MLLGLLAFNLANMMRNELQHENGSCWDLKRFHQTVLRAGARVVKKSRRLNAQIEAAVRDLWPTMIACIERLSDRWSKPRGARRRAYMPPPAHIMPIGDWFYEPDPCNRRGQGGYGSITGGADPNVMVKPGFRLNNSNCAQNSSRPSRRSLRNDIAWQRLAHGRECRLRRPKTIGKRPI